MMKMSSQGTGYLYVLTQTFVCDFYFHRMNVGSIKIFFHNSTGRLLFFYGLYGKFA